MARTARRRGFDKSLLLKLARNYSRGKADLQAVISGEQEAASAFDLGLSRGLSVLVRDGLERGIESELGALLDPTRLKYAGVKNIRLQLSRPQSPEPSPASPQKAP